MTGYVTRSSSKWYANSVCTDGDNGGSKQKYDFGGVKLLIQIANCESGEDTCKDGRV